MSLRAALSRTARWKYWDVVALVAGGVPLTLVLIGFYTGEDFGGLSGPLILIAALLCLIAAAFAWRTGDGRLIAGGCAMIIIPVAVLLPVLLIPLMLFGACVMGDCL
ncbi:MAG: hypothetical protein KYX64_03155 [Sphingopyxis sp.]|nr:hypothetical protein [Sphingopyxis sp.]